MTSPMPSPTRKTKDPARQGSPLAAALAARLAGSLLPDEDGLDPAELEAAASFLLATADGRVRGESAVAIETVTGPSGRRFMRLAVINQDMPFLVDSIATTVSAHGLVIDRLVHPVVAVERNGAGRIVALPEGEAPGVQRESMVYLETPRADARTRAALGAALAATLADVRAAVEDWPAMQRAMGSDAEHLAAMDREEGAALLRWFRDGMLTQLGHVRCLRDGTSADPLGICRNEAALLSGESYARAFAWFDAQLGKGGGRLPLVVKSNLIARVHRRVPLDLFILPEIEGGKVVALSVHAGVWTSAALATPPHLVPRMRAQLTQLMARLGFSASGHAGKALVHAMTKLPHDLLIGFEDADLQRVVVALMTLIDRPRPRLALVRAPLDRHLFAFVWLPRDALNTTLRTRIAAMLEAASGARVLDWALEVESNALAELRFVLDIREAGIPATLDETALDAQLQAMLRGWADAVEAELARGEDPARAAAIALRYAEAFPAAYRDAYGPAEAAADIARLRRLGGEGDEAARRDARLFRLAGDAPGQLRLKIYQRGGSLALSETVPVLENFGFRVIDEVPSALDEGRVGLIHDFQLALPAGMAPDELLARAGRIEAAIARVLNGDAEDDGFNRLIALVALEAREANWLRAWYRYLRQAGLNYSIQTAVDALANAPAVARGLVALFRARLEPGAAGTKAEEAAEAQIRDGLAQVAAINDDRLLRAFRAMIMAMLRTNAFAPAGAEGPETALAFKLDSGLVPGLPKPVPWREIFVYSARVEGIHLRAGPVARGGLRWSDRRDDFRTEILGLMKAQRVKNAVIVPTGAKGGFYPKHLANPAIDRDGWAAEGRAAYMIFIRTLLSITDNIVENKVVHPEGVHIRDGEDPYFVVAADKGTATFSDTANGIAEAGNFWLDDAFASGGSKGYDHKAMGITAKGAWVSVQRHFLEMGVDVQADPVRVVGVGDMSGDVFGNGMLLSRSIRLVAAFDHRHIFLDPDPDAAKSWAERSRMFALPRSSWEDYDKALISKGGGVYARSLKAIPLSPEVRAMLGLEGESIEPEGLMRAILKAKADLLWFGGIGTYVKGAGENNATVGDPANDALRVDGRELNVRVVGEGANLGCTQAGRIEFALAGGGVASGRIDTDFIDNSAGVDCSDKEVNIKIALASAKRAGRLDEPGRVELLTAMTDDVAHLVLEDNRLQALALSIAQSAGAAALGAQLRLIETLEDGGHLDRTTEGLADNETLLRRKAEGHGLARPELAVLLSSTKLVLQDALEHSTVVDDPALAEELAAAFPPAMQARFAEDIASHRLRREILATRFANRLVNRLGIVHPFELAEEEGVSLAEVTAAFLAAERLFGMAGVWQTLETAPMTEAARIALFDAAAGALRVHMADLLRGGVGHQPPLALAAELAPHVTAISDGLDTLLVAEARASSNRLRTMLGEAGAASEHIALVARLADLDGAVGLACLARDSGRPAVDLARAFTVLGGALGLDWAQGAAARMNPSDPWERLLVAGLARDFQQMRLDALRRLAGGAKDQPGAAVDAWIARQGDGVRLFRAMIARAQAAVPTSPAMLAQIAGQARGLLGR
ncbi:MAG: NAD-glutamate dehydrogenase [Proteobacteria bacterium]|nr:NAD-glutamate dehydrogenase [Pseudomonadota bacterium]